MDYTSDDLNQYTPYKKIQGYGNLPNIDTLPFEIRNYLMDLPVNGYTPVDDNRRFRCQLMKYLYYDCPDPLSQPMPTVEQKMSMVFDPDSPDKPPNGKQYRIFTQMLVHQAQTDGVTTMRIYMGRVLPYTAFGAKVGVVVEFLTNYDYDSNTRTVNLSKTYTMACLALRALSGVNFSSGVGTFEFNRRDHPDCLIEPINDESTNVGYRLVIGVDAIGSSNGE